MKTKVIILVLLFIFLLPIGLDKLGISADEFIGGVLAVGMILFLSYYAGSLLLEDYRKDCKDRTKVKNILNLLIKLLILIVMNYILLHGLIYDFPRWIE